MACVNPDGTITASARALLGAASEPMSPEELARKVGQPLFRVRSSLRELIGAGLIEESGEKYAATEQGKAKLKGG
jgi:predicted transcriptional regulator